MPESRWRLELNGGVARMVSLTQKEDRAQQVYDLICDSPGVGQSDIARGLGISVSQVRNSLIYMGKLGLAVSEDQHNRYYPFESIKVKDALKMLDGGGA